MRLTKRNGKFVFINTEAIPRSSCKGEYGFIPCQFMRSCTNVATRQCPILKILDRLADFEDKEENAIDVKSEVAMEIFEEIEKEVAPKIPMKIQPIFKDDRDFEGGFINGKTDALFDILVLISELKKKYTGGNNERN